VHSRGTRSPVTWTWIKYFEFDVVLKLAEFVNLVLWKYLFNV